MSLPLAFATDLSSILAEAPYLRADPTEVARWRLRVDDEPGLKVGLVWAGDSREHQADSHRVDKLRSMSLAHYAPLAQVDGVRFFSVQKGAPAVQAKTPPQRMRLVDYTDEFADFADTAALVSNLDLVITVDTSVGHLAGGLGVPTWDCCATTPAGAGFSIATTARGIRRHASFGKRAQATGTRS